MNHYRATPLLVDSAMQMMLVDGEPRIAHAAISRLIKIDSVRQLELIKKYQTDFEVLGVIPFETGKPKKGSAGGRPETVALLNEDQSYLLVTFSRNTAIARQVKLKLIMAFRAAREALIIRQQQYLPNYHQAHDAAHQMALYAAEHGSVTSESTHHINIEKLINKTFGIDAGARRTLPPEVMSAVSTAYTLIHCAIVETLTMGGDHKQAFQAAKQRVHLLAQLVLPPTTASQKFIA